MSKRVDDWKAIEKALYAEEARLADKLPAADKVTKRAIAGKVGRYQFPNN
jgi:hypothetical protein